jgi:hypothetical protein
MLTRYDKWLGLEDKKRMQRYGGKILLECDYLKQWDEAGGIDLMEIVYYVTRWMKLAQDDIQCWTLVLVMVNVRVITEDSDWLTN